MQKHQPKSLAGLITLDRVNELGLAGKIDCGVLLWHEDLHLIICEKTFIMIETTIMIKI
jgi:hypothetical protein